MSGQSSGSTPIEVGAPSRCAAKVGHDLVSGRVGHGRVGLERQHCSSGVRLIHEVSHVRRTLPSFVGEVAASHPRGGGLGVVGIVVDDFPAPIYALRLVPESGGTVEAVWVITHPFVAYPYPPIALPEYN